MCALSKIIFLNPAVSSDHLSLSRFVDETVEPSAKFFRSISRTFDISDTDTLIGFRKLLIVAPGGFILPDRIDDIFRKFKRRLNESEGSQI